MRRVLFRRHGLTIWSYPAMLYVGLLFGVVAGSLAARLNGLNPLRAYVATILLLIPALAGARLLWVFTHWSYYRRNPAKIWNRREGGFMMYGGLPAALLVSIPLLGALHLNFGAFWDATAFTILVGMIFARVGCFLNGCCAGRASQNWIAVRLPNHCGNWQKRIPNQLLEASCAAGVLAGGTVLRGRMPFSGALFLFVVLGYSAIRFAMEFLREREPNTPLFTVGHGASMLATLASVAVLTVLWPR